MEEVEVTLHGNISTSLSNEIMTVDDVAGLKKEGTNYNNLLEN